MPKLATKRAVGRPRTRGTPADGYKPEYCEMLVQHRSQGLSFGSFGMYTGYSKQHMYRWAEDYPEFLDAKAKAHRVCALFWEKLGMAGAMGKIPGFKVRVWMTMMRNLLGWSHRPRISCDALVEEEDERMIAGLGMTPSPFIDGTAKKAYNERQRSKKTKEKTCI